MRLVITGHVFGGLLGELLEPQLSTWKYARSTDRRHPEDVDLAVTFQARNRTIVTRRVEWFQPTAMPQFPTSSRMPAVYR
jgi:hypothetical protein